MHHNLFSIVIQFIKYHSTRWAAGGDFICFK